MMRSKSYEYIIVGIKKLVSTFYQTNINLSQNMYGSNEDHDYIAEQLASMRLFVDDELMTLNLIVKKPSNITAFKAL